METTVLEESLNNGTESGRSCE